MPSSHTRRGFLSMAAASCMGAAMQGQQPSVAHANVAELDRAHILSDAKAALAAPVQPPPETHFHTETEPTLATAGLAADPKLLRTDALALRQFCSTVAALAAGWLLTADAAYAERAAVHCKAWLIAPQTRLEPSFDMAGCAVGSTAGTPAGVVDLVPLAELARASSFLTDHFEADDLAAMQAWFTAATQWLLNDKQALIASDAKDHRASAHLLLTAAISRFTRDDSTMEDCRKRFRVHTLRNQVRPDGVFPQEVATPNPYRNTLFNLDLLAGACQLMSSQFDLLWDHELIDGVGMRTVAAYLYPVIAQPERWRYPADAHFFRDLPGRRPGMLFCGRAFSRPEYVETWLRAPPGTPAPELAYSFPITQPALWTARAPHGL